MSSSRFDARRQSRRGGGSFGRADFGLSALLETLSVPPGPWVAFDVTKAHRRFDPDADLNGFRFDVTDLSRFDQIWMFAVERAGSTVTVSDSELAALSRFMDAGGGVFATGDHEDLGVAMCGRIPRVRSMRMWHWPSPGPNGEPVAPKVDGVNRFDTLSAGGDAGVQFDDQSDDVPQIIIPRMYSLTSWGPYFSRSRPHPLLCGPRGVIRQMPDHPHEGQCYEPTDLSASFTFGGVTVVEYPAGIGPEVVATSRVSGGRLSTDVKGLLNPRTFGSIGAYDGHRAGVGRVVVDSTWHHFFDINLIGALGTGDPVKSIGFDYSVSGHQAFEDIKSYFRNIAVWIASDSAQREMWQRALWWLRWHHRIAMDLRPPFLERKVPFDLAELIRVGSEARDALGQRASQCTVLRWIYEFVVRPRVRRPWEELVPVLDPWGPRPPEPDPRVPQISEPMSDAVTMLHAEMLADAALGAAVYAVAMEFPVLDDEARDRAEKTDLAKIPAELVSDAFAELAAHAESNGAALAMFGDLLR